MSKKKFIIICGEDNDISRESATRLAGENSTNLIFVKYFKFPETHLLESKQVDFVQSLVEDAYNEKKYDTYIILTVSSIVIHEFLIQKLTTQHEFEFYYIKNTEEVHIQFDDLGYLQNELQKVSGYIDTITNQVERLTTLRISKLS